MSVLPLSTGLVVVTEATTYESGLPGIFLDETAVSPTAAQMDGAASAAFVGAVTGGGITAARMDGAAIVAFIGRGLRPGAAQMDGVASAAFAGGYVVRGAAEMDGAASVAVSGRLLVRGSAQMDGLTTPAFAGGVGGSHARMDGVASAAFTGIVTGGFHIGSAAMNGVASVGFAGVASVIVPGAARMDGIGSMLAVQTGAPLPSHGIILAAGI